MLFFRKKMSKMCEICFFFIYRNCVRISKLEIVSPKKKRISSKNLMEDNMWVFKYKLNLKTNGKMVLFCK